MDPVEVPEQGTVVVIVVVIVVRVILTPVVEPAMPEVVVVRPFLEHEVVGLTGAVLEEPVVLHGFFEVFAPPVVVAPWLGLLVGELAGEL